MWAPSFSVVRNVQLFILGLVCSSILLFVASYTIGTSSNTIQYPMIITSVAIAIFVRSKGRISHSGRRNLQIIFLCLSFLNAALLLFYAGRLISLAETEDTVVYYLLAGCDVAIAIMLVVDGVLSELYSIYMNSKMETSSRDSSSSRGDHASGTLQEPLPVHIYQPRLTWTQNERTSIHTGTTAPTNDNTEAAQQDDDSVELEELPKYERRRPAQQATIVDMANLQSVDTTVLGSAIPVSPLNVTDNEGRGFEQGQSQELRLELGELLTVEAPEYSPSLVEASPAPTYDLSPQLASSTSSGSSVVLAMPVSDPPVGPSPTASHTDAPTVTVTSAPPVYSP